MQGLNNGYNVENNKKWGLNQMYFEALPKVFEKHSSEYARRFLMYLFPKDDELEQQLVDMKNVIEESKHSLMTKMLIKKQSNYQKRTILNRRM